MICLTCKTLYERGIYAHGPAWFPACKCPGEKPILHDWRTPEKRAQDELIARIANVC